MFGSSVRHLRLFCVGAACLFLSASCSGGLLSDVSAASESSEVSTPDGAALGSSSGHQGALKTYCGVLVRIDAASEDLAQAGTSPSATEAAWRAMGQVHLQAALVAPRAVRVERQQLRELFDAAHLQLSQSGYALADVDQASGAWAAYTDTEAEALSAAVGAHDWANCS
jgi:hypothetical protein